MGNSILIYSNTKENRFQKIKSLINNENFSFENNPDLKIIEKQKNKKSIGIEEVRNIGNFLKIKPISHNIKVLIISEANYLTTEAQNSLLKILEEPPTYAFIFLESETTENLLATILSRCQKYKLENLKISKEASFDFINMSVGERFVFVEELAKLDKEDVILKLREILVFIRENKTKISRQNLDLLLSTIENLSKSNINTRLALENLSVNFK